MKYSKLIIVCVIMALFCLTTFASGCGNADGLNYGRQESELECHLNEDEVNNKDDEVNSKMDWEVIITVFTTLLLGVLGFIVNTLLQRRNNSIKIITQYRIERKNKTQEITAKLLSYTDFHYYESLTLEEKNKNVQNIVTAISELRSLYCFSFEKDAELVQAAYTLKKLFCSETKNWTDINRARAEYAHLADVFTSTDWKRIKLETVGGEIHNNKFLPKWIEIFNENESYFSNQNQANIEIFLDGESENNK